MNIAPAVGWSDGEMPKAAEGLRVSAFADGLDHPRWLHVLPNGDVLVAESNTPPKPAGSQGIMGWLEGLVRKRAGTQGVSANRITLLRDQDGDGVAEYEAVFLEGLNSPFGMALVGQTLFVANTDSVVQFPYRDGQTRIEAPGRKLLDLPAGKYNQHWTRSLLASRDGSRLYVGVGSASNIADHGMDEEAGRAAVWEVDLPSGEHRIFASGLRNPVGMDWEPTTGALWVAVNERDELGGDLVPDYMTAVRRGAFYGWPYSYFGDHVDERVTPRRPDLVAEAVVPDYALGAHTASLGLVFAEGAAMSSRFSDGAFVGQHGSWNRDPPSGYKVVFVPFDDGRPAALPIDVLDGFLNADGDAKGRPVGVAIGADGAFLVADDVGNAVWRVAAAGEPHAGRR